MKEGLWNNYPNVVEHFITGVVWKEIRIEDFHLLKKGDKIKVEGEVHTLGSIDEDYKGFYLKNEDPTLRLPDDSTYMGPLDWQNWKVEILIRRVENEYQTR